MPETPTGGHVDSFSVVGALLGISPFVFLVGLLVGLAAGLVVWPVAARLSDRQSSLEQDSSTYLRGPLVVGGLGLLASVIVDFARGIQPEQVGPGLGGRLLLVSGCLAAVAHHVQYRDATPERRRTNGYAYVAFVVVWTTFALGIYALWI